MEAILKSAWTFPGQTNIIFISSMIVIVMCIVIIIRIIIMDVSRTSQDDGRGGVPAVLQVPAAHLRRQTYLHNYYHYYHYFYYVYHH